MSQKLYPCFLHSVAADAVEVQGGIDTQHFPDKKSAMQIAGGFTGNDHHPGRMATRCAHVDIYGAFFSGHY
jgi:hypothetical protein